MTTLARLISANLEAIVQDFADRAYESTAASALGRDAVIDDLREFLAAVAVELAGGPRAPEVPASAHGEERFSLGYELGAVVREYILVSEAVYQRISVTGAAVRVDELQRFSTILTRSISYAAGRYAALRDAELRARTGEHLAFLAHELRNPLGSAMMAFSLLQQSGQLADSRPAVALARSLKRLSTFLDDALVAVRLQNLPALRLEPVDVGELLHELVEEVSADADAKAIRFDVEGSGRCAADPRALRSALSNLVRNAVKFTAMGGVVTIRLKAADGRLIVEVEDQCGGLPPGTIHKLFDPYVQVGADRSGFGLGLAIAKQAADAHGGEVRVHDLAGRGCVFVIDIPVAPPTSSSTTKLL